MKNYVLIALSFVCLINAAFGQVQIDQIFRERMSRSYIPDISDVYGVAFRDINGDQLPDIYLVRYIGDNKLLINNGAYRPFKDATEIAGLAGNPRPKGVYKIELGSTTFDLKYGTSIVDIDNDWDGDILIAGWGISTAMYRNDGNLSFTNVTDQLEIFPPIDANGIISADVDNNGLVDIFITDEHYNNRLLLNSSQGIFRESTDTSGLSYNGMSKSAGFCDLDNDGDQDLVVTNWGSPDLLYRNLGDGTFQRMMLPIEVCEQSLSTTSISFGDLDRDGRFDMYITNFEGPNIIYLNRIGSRDTSWSFESCYIDANEKSYGSVIADFDLDGSLDIFVTNFGRNTLHLRPLSNRSVILTDFMEDPSGQSTGAACADFDQDGDLDLFIANKDVYSLFYQNASNVENFIKLNLSGITSNRDAIGARVDIYRAGYSGNPDYLLGSRFVSGGSGFLSYNDPIVHFGLDSLFRVDAVIRFPSGKIITELNLAPGHSYEIFEYPTFFRSVILFWQQLMYQITLTVFWYQIILAIFFILLTIIFIRLGLRRYRWSSGTLSGYLAGFFILAIIASTALKKLGLLSSLLAINIITIAFVVVIIFNSERFYRLRRIRERYREVLLNLSNQIVNIHDDDQLFRTVVQNIRQYSDFEHITLLALDTRQTKFTRMESSRKGGLSLNKFNSSNLDYIIGELRSERYLNLSERPVAKQETRIFQAGHAFAIERNERLFGIILLGVPAQNIPLNREDIDLFKFIGTQMAIAMENNEYLRKSTEMIKKLTEAEVREKYLQQLEKTNAELDVKNRDLQKLYDELRNTQAQLIHSEKMASLGQLVAGISHELNNPIGFIYSNIKQLQQYTGRIENFVQSLPEQTAELKHVRQILPDIKGLISDTISGSHMIKELVANLRNFSHLDRAKWEITDIHQGLESSIKILMPQFKHQLKIHKSYHAKGQIACNPGQLNQVFLNILANAAQAVGEKGNIWIETSDMDNNLVIKFRDDGIGMEKDVLSKIFDPFFTTKKVGEGTGLGLSISYSIIQNHGGKIQASSEPGKGTTFSIILPYGRSGQSDDG